MGKILFSVLQTIGNTPLIDLQRLAARHGLQGRILAKLDSINPSFSKKDRIALHMIEEAEKAGRLKPGQLIVEETSGNTGNGLALVCAVKGYRFVAAMSRGNSMERVKMMRGLGAELLLVDQAPDSKPGLVSGADLQLVEEAARRYAKENGAYLTGQFFNEENNEAHELTTAKEIWEQTDGTVAYFADFAGTGGTFAGTSKGLKQYNPRIKCFIVEPAGGAVYGGGDLSSPGHRIQGGGYAKVLDLIDRQNIDGAIPVTDEEAIAFTRELAQIEGIFAGFSSGANVCAAVKLLRGQAKGKDVAVLINDSGLKYLSTDLFV
ncbi:MAG: cysteine synthase family protein [Clostridiales bacterium]|nr:cysteine synthase family protein [Clostridiales bacterium]